MERVAGADARERMSKGFQKGDPRAVAAGKKGGSVMRPFTRSVDYKRGYQAGWKAKQRAARTQESV